MVMAVDDGQAEIKQTRWDSNPKPNQTKKADEPFGNPKMFWKARFIFF